MVERVKTCSENQSLKFEKSAKGGLHLFIA